MAEFTQQQKELVVDLLAVGKGLSEVSQLLVELYGKEQFPKPPPTSQIARYKPDCGAGGSLSDELKQRFWDRREAMLRADGSDCLISSRDFRQNELLDLYQRNKARGADALAAKFLEQAAKDKGGMFERPMDGLTDEDVAAIVERRMNRVKAVIAEHVTDAEVRDRVIEAIKAPAAGPADGEGGGGG